MAGGLLASAHLGFPAAAAALGTASHALSPAVAAALVAGGRLTLVLASIGAALLGGPSAPPDGQGAGEGERAADGQG